MLLGFNPRIPFQAAASVPPVLTPPHSVEDWWDFTDLDYTDLTANVPNKGTNTTNTGAPNGTTAAFGTGHNGLRYFNTLGFQTFESINNQTSKAATIMAVVDLGTWATNNSEPFIGTAVGETRASVAAATQPSNTLNIAYAATESDSFTMGYGTNLVVLVLEFVGGDCKISAYNTDGTSVTSGDLALATGGTGEFAFLAEGLWIGADSNTTLNIPLLKIYEVLMWSGSDIDNTRQLTDQQILDVGEQYFAVKYNFTWTEPTPPGPSDPIGDLNPLVYYDLTDNSSVTVNGSNVITAITNKGSSGVANDITSVTGSPELVQQPLANNHYAWDSETGSLGSASTTLSPELGVGVGEDQTILVLVSATSPNGVPMSGTGSGGLSFSYRSQNNSRDWLFQGANVRDTAIVTKAGLVTPIIIRKTGGGAANTSSASSDQYRFEDATRSANRAVETLSLGSRGGTTFQWDGQIFGMAAWDHALTDAEIQTMLDGLDTKFDQTTPPEAFLPHLPVHWHSGFIADRFTQTAQVSTSDSYNTSTGLVTLTANTSSQWSAGMPIRYTAGAGAPPELTTSTTYYWLPETSSTGYLYHNPEDVIGASAASPIVPSTATGGDTFRAELSSNWFAMPLSQEPGLYMKNGSSSAYPGRLDYEVPLSNPLASATGPNAQAAVTSDANVSPLNTLPYSKLSAGGPGIPAGPLTVMVLAVPRLRKDATADNPVSQRMALWQDGGGTAYIDLQGATDSASPYTARCFTYGSVMSNSDSFVIGQMHAFVYRHDGVSTRNLDVLRFTDDVWKTQSGTQAAVAEALSAAFVIQTRQDIADIYEIAYLDVELTNAEVNTAVKQLGAFYGQTVTALL